MDARSWTDQVPGGIRAWYYSFLHQEAKETGPRACETSENLGLGAFIRCSKHVLFGIGFCCLTEPAGSLLFVYWDCEVVHKDPFFFSHQQICERLKVRGSCHFSCLQKKVEIGTWFGSEDRGGYGKHFGPVYSVKRNPFHVKFFLSVGDWCGKMWMEELKGGPLKDVVEWRVRSETTPIFFWLANCQSCGKVHAKLGACFFFLGGLYWYFFRSQAQITNTLPNIPRNRPLKYTPKQTPDTYP